MPAMPPPSSYRYTLWKASQSHRDMHARSRGLKDADLLTLLAR
jgi:hypothetical protein